MDGARGAREKSDFFAKRSGAGPSKLRRDQKREAIERRDRGEALTDIARTFGVSHTTIGRLTASAAQRD
jgi:hypothetical protein